MSLHEYDRTIQAQHDSALICGVDEAGRGPLAGPVYAAAVILPPGIILEGLDDSKKLSEKKRESLFRAITECAETFCIASADVGEIESLNILGASMLAMRRAVEGLIPAPGLVLADGNTAPHTGLPTRAIVGGDGLSACIAAASILAKISRDQHMRKLDTLYPGYGFAKHKGYGTKHHYQILDNLGPCPEHRPSFLRKWRASR